MRIVRVLGCFTLIGVMDLLIQTAGMRRTLRLLMRTPVRAFRSARPPAETARLVSFAAAFYPRRALCLEQSLALCWLLRRHGIAAELRLGVQPRPFYAHAWVEVDGVALAEPGELPLNMVALRTAGAQPC